MLSINYKDPRPIYEQVRDALRQLILSGAIAPGEKLGLVNTVAGKGAFAATDGTAALRWREELMATLSSTLRELKLLGVSESELQSMVLAAFRKEDET